MAVMDANHLGPAPRRITAFLVLANWSPARTVWTTWSLWPFSNGAFGEAAEENRGRCLGW